MKKKVTGIFVCTLLIAASALSVSGAMIKQEKIFSIDGHGGMIRQIPYSPDNPKRDCWGSLLEPFYQVSYENFFDVGSPICTVHCWGQICSYDMDTGKFYHRDSEGMTFDIVFYEDDMGKPGDEVCSYNDVTPTMVKTGIIYKYPWAPGVWDLYYLKYDLNPSCSLSKGWVSICNSNSPNDCVFCWATSPDGDGRALLDYVNFWQDLPDLALMLSDEEETSLEISIKGGFGSTIEITNNGAETLTNVPIDIMVFGGILRQINVHIEEVISSLEPGGKTSIETGFFFGLGKIAIGVIADDVAEYHSGRQLLIFTMVK